MSGHKGNRQFWSPSQTTGPLDETGVQPTAKPEVGQTVLNLTRHAANLGIVALGGAQPTVFFNSLAAAMPDSNSLLVVDAFGTIQGMDTTASGGEDYYDRIVYHRGKYGTEGILAFLGFNYGDNESEGSYRVSRYIRSMMVRNERSGKRRGPGPAILLVGDGRATDMRTAPGYHGTQQHPLARLISIHLALNHENDLSTTPQLDARFSSVVTPDDYERRAYGSTRRAWPPSAPETP